jgi:hypothetical protein
VELLWGLGPKYTNARTSGAVPAQPLDSDLAPGDHVQRRARFSGDVKVGRGGGLCVVTLEGLQPVTPASTLLPMQRLTYPFREGTRLARWAGQFRALLCDLARLHSANYVFADVREHNLVFHATDWQLAWLVDFDLAGPAGSMYPGGFNVALPERAGLWLAASDRMDPSHDLHALGWIMLRYAPVNPADLSAWRALGDSVMTATTAAMALALAWPSAGVELQRTQQ